MDLLHARYIPNGALGTEDSVGIKNQSMPFYLESLEDKSKANLSSFL